MADCLAGDGEARGQFQERFGQLIYRFAEHASATGRNDPGDFYVYLFEDDRVYRRLRSYEGRASLGPFLRGFVLPDMFRQFQQMTKSRELETVSLNSDCAREPAVTAAALSESTSTAPRSMPVASGSHLLRQIEADKQLLVKLLYIEDFELEPGEVQALARRTRRSVREVVELIEQARESIRQRETGRREKLEEVESASQWILRYERALNRAADSLANLPPRSERADRLREQQAELERKRTWRQRQRERALQESGRATVTLRYREIAEILNMPVGSVSAQITRLRQELSRLAAEHSDSPIGRCR